MKVSFAFVAALAGLAAAKCSCKKDQCYEEISAHGLPYCSAYLTVTVTGQPVTLTETATEPLSEYTTQTDIQVLTSTETTTASTETLHFTDTTSTTATTTTEISVTTETTVASTETQTQTLVTTTVAPAKRKFDELPFPALATLACASLPNIVSACRCAGVKPATVTVTAALVTTTVTSTTPVLSTVTTSVSTTTVATDSVTETVSETTTEVDPLTATETSTAVATVSATTTTVTTATPSAAVCLKGAGLGSFTIKAQVGSSYSYMYGLVGANGQVLPSWTSNTGGLDGNVVVWELDDDGVLHLSYNDLVLLAQPTSTTYMPIFVVANLAPVVVSSNAGAWEFVTGCVDPDSRRLTLKAGNKQIMLDCSGGFKLTADLGGNDVTNCQQVLPIADRI
ncbi:hypothetical protein QBC47DRAFT_410638 [Echria macrotheca]|uniref:Uncharacterized protein n=1 Tax=Echria macrotheca TaxID=438768 RepID=A0AAJ0FAB9_9PEZI|nr:hypothetical protein QBC47DRAFT_410638 [Echria macrotheca]